MFWHKLVIFKYHLSCLDDLTFKGYLFSISCQFSWQTNEMSTRGFSQCRQHQNLTQSQHPTLKTDNVALIWILLYQTGCILFLYKHICLIKRHHSWCLQTIPLGQGVLSSRVHPSCLSVCLSIILDHGQRYIPQPQFTCQIIDTDVLL